MLFSYEHSALGSLTIVLGTYTRLISLYAIDSYVWLLRPSVLFKCPFEELNIIIPISNVSLITFIYTSYVFIASCILCHLVFGTHYNTTI